MRYFSLHGVLRTAVTAFAAVVAVCTSFAETNSAPRTVKVSFYEYEGCHLISSDGVKSGYGYDFFELLAAKTGWKVEYIGYDKPWSEVTGQLERGEVDVVDFVGMSPERLAKFGFSKRPMAYSGCSIRTTPENLGKFVVGRFGDWGKVRVGVMEGDQNELEFMAYAADRNIDYEIRRFHTEPLAIAALKRGELDMVAFDGFASMSGLKTLEDFNPCRNYLMVRKNEQALLKEIDDAMAALDREDPGWMMRIRAKYYPLAELTAYIPGGEIGWYVGELLYYLAEVGGWRVVTKKCRDDFSDADFSVPSLACGVMFSAENAKRFDIPLMVAGRRRVDVFALPENGSFKNGVKNVGRPIVVGCPKNDAYLRASFERYADENHIPFKLVTCDTEEEMYRAQKDGRIDLSARFVSPGCRMKSVANCGYVDFYIAAPKGRENVAHSVSEAMKYLRLNHPDMFLDLERRHFGTGDDDSRLVRLGAYVERGLSERSEDGTHVGLVSEYVNTLAHRSNWNVETVFMTYPEAQRALANGKIDLMGAAIWTEERAKVYDYSKFSIGPLNYVLLKRNDGRMQENRPDTWNNMVVGVMRGSKATADLERYLAERKVKWSPMYFNNLHDAEVAVRAGSLDAVYTLLNPYNRDLTALAVLPTELCYFCSNKRKPWIKKEMDAVTETLLRENVDYIANLSKKYFSEVGNMMQLDLAEIGFVKKYVGRKVTVGFTLNMPPLVNVDAESGEISGFYVNLFRRLAQKTGLEFEFLPPGKPADFTIVQGEKWKSEGGLVVDGEWLKSPVFKVCRRGFDISGKGVAAVSRARAEEIEFVRRRGYEPLVFESREECYRALAAGRADILIDDIAVALYQVEEQKMYSDLSLQRIDPSVYHRKVTAYSSTETDPRLRSILAKARDSLSSDELDALLFEAVYSHRRPYVHMRTLLTVVGGLLMVVAIVWFVAYMRLRHEHEMNEAINRERKKAEAANASKTVFLNNMSHDIRTPMNAICGFSAMARKCIGDREKVEDCLEKIDVSGHHLLELINEVLDMSRIESGKIELHYGKVDAVKQYESFGIICGESAADKGVKLDIATPKLSHRYVVADSMRVNQVLLNLLGNAIKYTNPGGTVKMTVEEQDCGRKGWTRILITVADTGIGIGKEFLEHVFEPFAREQTSTISGIEGTGLGMAIVKKIVDLCGGTIEVESEVDKGTTVRVTFDFEVADSGGEDLEDVVSGAEATDVSGRRILLVEDNALNREIARYILEENGVAVEETVNGAEAVKAVQNAAEGYFDWVLMDIQMPEMNGYEATRAIRAWEKENGRRPLFIIAMTANAFDEDRRLAEEAGMNKHLAKPVAVEKLLAALRSKFRI